MKTFLQSLALALTVSIVTTATSLAEAKPIGRPNGTVAYRAGIYTTMNGNLSIALDKETGGTVDVRLKNAEGTVLYSQQVSKNESQYRSRLNLSDLPDGTYQVEITNGVETKTHTITLSTQQPAAPGRVLVLN
ncbi:T9SS type A sorting domain-containing protein [Spirosoma agri]|uniref:T9SS type A sorting domain-containing protein n=1 Tax=Spirosoma agri TaxID=1987381 RepID=A0A6M0IE55_9BACT|nr:T9SS type A sorting domain-containing protein [Spirosoma agri]NEU66035.1 T9SS type A sorting domain-containing protein [Spirosoma agri]